MKKNICVLLCALILTATFISAKTGLTPFLMKNANYGTSRLKTIGAVNTLFIGSSMFRQGISTQFYEDSYLLCYNANQPFAINLTIEELIDSGVSINLLVVDMYAFSIAAVPDLSDSRILQDHSPKFNFSMYQIMHNEGDAGFFDLYEMLVQANNEMFLTWPISFPFINSRYFNGSNTVQKNGATAEKLEQLSTTFDRTALNKTQAEALESLISLCADKNISVVFLETPKYVRLYESDVYCSIMTEYATLLDHWGCKQIMSLKTAQECGLQESTNRVLYSFDIYDPSSFTDLSHMSSDGRARFSEILIPLLED